MKRTHVLGAVALALAVAWTPALALEGKLVIVTSYPPDTTVTVKKAFEKRHPGVKVEMLKKKTTAGIKYLQETARNNTSDMFWASAPDAFEVSKEDGLLQKYQVKVTGIAEMVGAFPINHPEGYYKGFGVPDGVNSGQFGLGVVIDFFGLASKASGFPVDFLYPPVTTLVPANIAIVKNARNREAAAAFIEFLLSPEGQEVLLDPKIMRLPVNPATYAKAPPGFPNPFKDKSIGAAVKFDLQLSKGRYNVVNSLFDVMITYRQKDLRAATKAIQSAEKKLAGKSNPGAAKLIDQARALVSRVPITAAEAGQKDFNRIFKKKRKKATTKVTGRQAQIEQKWDAQVQADYAKAKELAEKAVSMM